MYLKCPSFKHAKPSPFCLINCYVLKFLKLKAISLRSSLFYNTRARHKRLKCDTSDKSATRVKQKQHECDTNDTTAKQVKNFDFDKDSNEHIFLHPYISYMSNKGLQGEEQFHYKNNLSEILCSHAKLLLKSAP